MKHTERTICIGEPVGNLGKGGKAYIDPDRMLDTRVLIQANSGGGKSTLLRLLCESAAKHIQTIIIDPEGELWTLREAFDCVTVRHGGDVAATVATAGKLGRYLVEMNLSAVVDLSDLVPQKRREYVRDFLNAIMSAPRKFWHPILIGIDEAHQFCPQRPDDGDESSQAVIGLMSLGRKRGYCGALCTQRLSKLHKDAAAECNNVLIGRTALDVDQKRAGDMLGMNNVDRRKLRDLPPGTFYGYGPAFSFVGIEQIQTKASKTAPPPRGHAGELPAPSAHIKKVIPDLQAAIDAAAGDPLDLEAALKRIRELEKAAKAGGDPEDVRKLRTRVRELETAANAKGISPELRTAQERIKVLERGQQAAIRETVEVYRSEVAYHVQRAFDPYRAKAQAAIEQMSEIAKSITVMPDVLNKVAVARWLKEREQNAKPENHPPIDLPAIIKRAGMAIQDDRGSSVSLASDKGLGKKHLMLRWAVRHYPEQLSKPKWAALCGMGPGNGSFKTYAGALRTEGLIDYPVPGMVVATEAGLAAAGDVGALPKGEAIVEMWRGIIGEGLKRKIFEALYEAGTGGFDDPQALCDLIGTQPSNGSYKTYIGALRTLNVVTKGRPIALTPELWEAICA